MGIDINAIRGRLNKLQNTQKKTESLWKTHTWETSSKDCTLQVRQR